ncbi:hypothetical protein PILCRDRAFT_823216 [Piloderma croceum F 1598]|uniref:Uncharacterized protein n=1 Tax=Piloderma croceum (strain F 1598) TaxID=765440 RepID=A0A0C3BQW3_PILCF|nr:hypothetical protein PILCRDRAFT_823216 [Piloderma croceum F 1598]
MRDRTGRVKSRKGFVTKIRVTSQLARLGHPPISTPRHPINLAGQGHPNVRLLLISTFLSIVPSGCHSALLRCSLLSSNVCPKELPNRTFQGVTLPASTRSR